MGCCFVKAKHCSKCSVPQTRLRDDGTEYQIMTCTCKIHRYYYSDVCIDCDGYGYGNCQHVWETF
mgnify:CR=1 FL=1